MPKKSIKRNPIKPKDTVRVNTTGGYKIAVKRNSPYHKQAIDIGAVINQLRPGGGKLTEDNDRLSVKNYNRTNKK